MHPAFKALLRRAVTKSWERLRLRRAPPVFPERLPVAGLYLHVPFCENLCPFCPYNRWQYEPAAFSAFEAAVRREVSAVARRTRVGRITSLYVGGGTPTVEPEGLLRVLTHMRSELGAPESACVELHPAWASPRTLRALREWGVDRVSIGAQSFEDRHLEALGRKHTAADAEAAVRQAREEGFSTVNVDILFALPGQTIEETRRDARRAIAAGANQLSTYPLFGFPYSDLGQRRGLAGMERPSGRLTRRMLAALDEAARAGGLERCAVWSWKRPAVGKFSSVSRHRYLGFGPSAASMTGRTFSVNTFHVEAYAAAVADQGPSALCMEMTAEREMAYWLYWRLYEMEVDAAAFRRLWGRDLDEAYGALFLVPRLLGWMRRTQSGYEVTGRGAYWVHRLQNEFSLDHIVKLWGPCRRAPWPSEVTL